MPNENNIKRKSIVVSFPSHFQEISLIKTGILDCLLMKGYYLIIVVNDVAEKIHLEEYFLGKNVTIVSNT